MPNIWTRLLRSPRTAGIGASDEYGPHAAPVSDRVDADYNNPTKVLEAVHKIVGDRYMWGSDNPYMSWCDDRLRILYTYEQETAVLADLPEAIRRSMLMTAPEAWLYGPRPIAPAVEGIIFDMDGVLCASEPFICEAAMAMFTGTYGVTVQKDDFIPFVGTGEDRFIGGVAEKYGVKLTMPRDKARTYEIYLGIIKGRLEPFASAV